MGDAAKQAKALYCTEQRNVYIGARWTESTYAYPERSDDNPAEVRASAEAETHVRTKNNRWSHQKSAEAIVSRKRAAPERGKKKCRGLTKDEGLNVRKEGGIKRFMAKAATTETL